MGINSEAEFQDEDSKVEETVGIVTRLSRTAGFRSVVVACLSCRSGDDVADGGHIIVPSIGQDMWFMSAASRTSSLAIDRAGNAHMVPMIWQKANNSTSAISRMLSR